MRVWQSSESDSFCSLVVRRIRILNIHSCFCAWHGSTNVKEVPKTFRKFVDVVPLAVTWLDRSDTKLALSSDIACLLSHVTSDCMQMGAGANEQPNEHKTNESPAERRDVWECREHVISDTKRNQNITNDLPAISSQAVTRKSLGLSVHRASNILGKTGYND